MSGRKRHIDQFLAGFSTGDAISNEAVLIRNHLRACGFRSEIFCEQYTERDAGQVLPYRSYHGRRNSVIIYHHSYHTRILQKLGQYASRKLLVFHNVTPPGYVEPYNRRMAESLARARDELRDLRDSFDAVFAVSRFNAGQLSELGFSDVRVMPVPLLLPDVSAEQVPGHLRYLTDGKVNILFVGRIVPNKRHQDLIKAFYFFKKRRPQSRLLLVGPFHPGARGYAAELHNLVQELKLSESVHFTGMVPDLELPFFYREAHAFLSMSEHEGFFVPLIESMHYRLPILAYASSVVPETLGTAGVQFSEKDFPRVALMLEMMTRPGPFRSAVQDTQTKRLLDFDSAEALRVLDRTIESL